MIDNTDSLPVTRQCELLGVPRSTAYYQPATVTDETLTIVKAIDEIHTRLPFLGSRRILDELEKTGLFVNRKRVQRLMSLMGITALYQKPRTSRPGYGKGHRVYPYLLGDLETRGPNHVWVADITFIPMAAGFAYLVAIMDLHSRKILTWRLSNTPDARFCVEALEEALQRFGKPEIFNTDQGSQFTSIAFTSVLEGNGVRISMDSKGSWIDNVFIERFWRSIKYEEIYLHAYENVAHARIGISRYIAYYNGERRHSSLDRLTPNQAYDAAEPRMIIPPTSNPSSSTGQWTGA